MQNDLNNSKRFLLSDAGASDRGNTKTYVTVSDNLSPVGSFTVKVSSVYSQAKDPHAHQIKLTLFVDSASKLKRLASFLADAADDLPSLYNK
jgi:hypothetical protein